MRTSLIEIKQIEDWLLRRGDIKDRLVTEAKIISSPEIREKAEWQMKSYDLIRQYGREKFLQEVKAVEYGLFHSPKHKSFQNRIKSIFKSCK